MQNLFDIIEIIVLIISILSIIILCIGVILSIKNLCLILISKSSYYNKMMRLQNIRIELGSYVLLALEILIAADIVDTITHPTVTEIIELAVIVVIRTVISVFLNKEIQEIKDIPVNMKFQKEDDNI